MPTAFNVWTPQGNVVANPGGNKIGNPSVIFDTNPIVLIGNTNVFKMWAGFDTAGTVYYFESLDGISWTPYASNPLSPGGTATSFFPTVYKEGSTYYLYSCPTNLFQAIAVFTSSDGITWTPQGTQLTVGGVGTWDSNGLSQPNIVDIISGTWYAYYSGENASGVFGQGLITSTDGIHWTKSPSNPIFPGQIGNSSFLKVGSTYYMYATFPNSNATLATNQNNPMGRWSASLPSGPWTQLQSGGVNVPTYYVATPSELDNGTSLPAANANDPRIVSALGNMYLYYTYTTTGGTEQSVNAAIATGFTPAQLVATYEGVVNVPFSGLTTLNLSTLASDNFTRANANPIGGNWTPRVAGDTAQILSNVVNASAVATPADSYWNALTWNADQWSRITVHNETTGSFLGSSVRVSTSGAATAYRIILQTGTGAGSGLAVQSQVAGVSTNIVVLVFPINVGDTILAVVIGTNLLVYWNDALIYNASTSSIASGASGFELQGTTLVTNSGISAWSGGSFQKAPPIIIPSNVYSQPDCRNYGQFPNQSRLVNGTLIYDVQTSSNPAIAPVDSRASKPVASGNYTQNSRTPGTFGPGE